jgi:hypothetical protein
MQINNIAEAREAVAELGVFLEKFNRTLGALGNLTGNLNGQSEMGFVGRAESTPPIKVIPKPAPETMQQRVVALLSDSTKALTPKEMETKYLALGWPQTASGKLYSQILSTAYYLSSKKKILTNNHGKYSITIAKPNEQTIETNT